MDTILKRVVQRFEGDPQWYVVQKCDATMLNRITKVWNIKIKQC